MALSTLIVQRGIASIREVEEALARQVLYGGDLVTNLLEIRRVDEDVLCSILAEATGVSAGPAGALPRCEPYAKSLLAPEVALERNFVPLETGPHGLVLAVAEPLSAAAEQELSFGLAVPIAQRIVPYVRLREALAREYGAPLERRLQRLLSRMKAERLSAAVSNRPDVVASPATSNRPDVVASPATSNRPNVVAPNGTSASHGSTGVASPPPGGASAPATMPFPEGQAAGSDPAIEASTSPRDITTDDEARVPLVGSRTLSLPARRIAMTVDEARASLEESSTRDAVFERLFAFFRQQFEYSLMFVVHGEVAEGRDAFGAGASREKVLRIGVPLDMPSLLAAAWKRKTPVLSMPSARGIDSVLVHDVERKLGTMWAVFPVIVGKRVVAMLLGDCGTPVSDTQTVREIETVVGYASAAFERLVVRRRALHTTLPGIGTPAAVTNAAAAAKAEGSGSGLSPHSREGSEGATQPREAPEYGSQRARSSTEIRAARSAATVPSNLGAAARAARLLARKQAEGSGGHARRHARRGEAPELVFRAEPGASHEFESHEAFGVDVVVSVPPPASSPAPDTPRVPMPPSEQQISVGAHAPPSSHDATEALPSVIVDVASEYVSLVERVVAAPSDPNLEENVELELLRAGGDAMPAIMAQFPGPVTIDRRRLSEVPLPRVAECGPVLRLVANQRRTALSFVLSYVDDADDDKRFWATYLLTELVYPEVLDAIVRRVLDENARVRRAARAAARAFAEVHPFTIVDRLGSIAVDRMNPAETRGRAIDALGETYEPLAVPVLIPILDDPDRDVAAAAQYALTAIARQDFGPSSRKWKSWWSQNSDRHRIEWLIDALGHDTAAIRTAASCELQSIMKESFGYEPELSKRDRERVQARYRQWWNDVGRVRFSRAASARG